MLNILVTLIVIVLIWMYYPLLGTASRNMSNSYKSSAKMQRTAKDFTNETVQQVNYAKQLQQEEQTNLEN